MDANYVYMVAARDGVDYQNADGEFFKGLFGNLGSGSDGGSTDGGSEGEGKVDPQAAVAVGMTLLGVAGNWLAKRRERKEQEQRGYYYPQMPTTPPPRNNTALYVIGGLSVIGIGVAIYLATKK